PQATIHVCGLETSRNIAESSSAVRSRKSRGPCRPNAQCFHLGKQRTAVSSDKVTLQRVREVFEWVESNMIAFIESLDFRSQIRLETADLVKQERIAAEMIIKPTLSSATNIPSTIATTTLM